MLFRSLVLIIGADVAQRFGEWRDPAGIRQIAKIAVCGRPQASGPKPQAFDTRIFGPELDISSTAIRARAAAGLPLAGWVPSTVADYIVASRLYVE